MSFDQNYVLNLLSGGARESRTLEYKSEFYEHGGKGNHELCKDVSAFANTNGGLIIIGVREEEDLPKIEGVDPSEIGNQILRMNSTLVSKLDPRLGHIDFHPIKVEDKTILVIEIPASFQGPHRVNIDDRSWFYLRTASQVQTMDTIQIREAFLRSGDIFAVAKKFRAERITRIDAGAAYRNLARPTKLILHVVPVAESRKYFFASVNEFPSSIKLPATDEFSAHRILNFDGATYGFSNPPREVVQYVHLYRDGSVESVLSVEPNHGDRLDPNEISQFFIVDTMRALDHCRTFHNGDFVVMFSVLGATGLKFSLTWGPTYGFDRHEYCLPEIFVSKEDTSSDSLRKIFMPAINLLYQAAGNDADLK